MELSALKNIGLTDNEIQIYNTLLNKGELPVKEIIKETDIKKGDCYNKIYDLTERGLVEEFTKNKVKYYRLAHPQVIADYVYTKSKEIHTTEREINALLPSILSTYNLSYHKPGVQFFEGAEALDKLTSDSLTAKTEILSFVDSEAVLSDFTAVNRKYLKKRLERGIVKKIIVQESEFNRNYFTKHQELTEVKYIDFKLDQFKLNFQIYDDKISFLTLSLDHIIGIIIEDPLIAKLQSQLFEYIWQTAHS